MPGSDQQYKCPECGEWHIDLSEYDTVLVVDTGSAPSDYASPDWETGGRVHNWKNHISGDLKGIWYTFTDVQKAIIAKSAQENADSEEWD